jgi:hypothetical protein
MDRKQENKDAACDQPSRANHGLPTEALDLFTHFQNMFSDIDRGHHKNLHAFLAGAVATKRAFLLDSRSYGLLRSNQSLCKLPEKLTDSRGLMICMTKATSTGGENLAGKYARVVDYMVAKRINDPEGYLNQHGRENILNKAIAEFPSKRNTRKKGTSQRLTLRVRSSDAERIKRVQKKCDAPVTFLVRCEMAPGAKGGISGRIELGIEPKCDVELSSKQMRELIAKQSEAWKLETKLAGGISPQVVKRRGNYRFFVGLRGDPLVDPPKIRDLTNLPGSAKSRGKSRVRRKPAA